MNNLDSLYNTPGHRLRRAHQLIVSKFYEACAGISITPVQFAAMTAIESEGMTDATRLSSLIAFDRSTLGNVLDRMERKKLLIRTSHPTDRRIKLLSLTDQGKLLLEQARPHVEDSQEKFLQILDVKDREVLARILQQIIDADRE